MKLLIIEGICNTEGEIYDYLIGQYPVIQNGMDLVLSGDFETDLIGEGIKYTVVEY